MDDQTEETTEQTEQIEENTAVETNDNATIESAEETEEKRGMRPWEAFKNFAIVFSFIINFVLIIILLLIAPIIIPIVSDVAVPIVGGLNDSFVDMEKASIIQTIQVSDTMPISLTVNLHKNTVVTLTAPVKVNAYTTFTFPDGGGAIHGMVSLDLPTGLALPVELNVDVPIDEVIPVQLDVVVDIPLNETELGGPFNQLKELFGPIDVLLRDLPSSNEDLTERVKSSIINPPPDEETETPPAE